MERKPHEIWRENHTKYGAKNDTKTVRKTARNLVRKTARKTVRKTVRNMVRGYGSGSVHYLTSRWIRSASFLRHLALTEIPSGRYSSESRAPQLRISCRSDPFL